jgi:glycosyltransferase involved in cell wall biosynthesis
LAILVPARSEEPTIGSVITNIINCVASHFDDFFAIAIDDQSDDSTADEARLAGALVATTAPGQSGLGAAFNLGVQIGLDMGATLFLNIDSDGQYDPSDTVKLFGAWMTGAELVVGNRLSTRPHWMRSSRYLTNRAFSGATRRFVRGPKVDCQSGFRMFTRDLALACPIKSNFTYTQEQYIRAARQEFPIAAPPIAFLPRRFGTSRLVRSTSQYALNVVGPAIGAMVLPIRRRQSLTISSEIADCELALKMSLSI